MSTAGPAHRVESAAVEYGYPQGHLGHLTDEEEVALKEFKDAVIELQLYKPQTDEHEYGTHDDAMLLRFLRARRFNVQDAVVQFKDTEEWRNANSLDTLYETIDMTDYDETRRLYPQWTGRRDRRGIPVYLFEVKHLNSKTMSTYEKNANATKHKAQTDGKTPAKLLRLFSLYENLVRFVMPMSTALIDRPHARTPITQSNNIVDISGVGLKQFWNLRTHMQDASTLATAHYPETLDRIFIIGAPAFFPTVWGWIKRWFDPITTSKIFILSAADMDKTLKSFIDPANIPVKYGGELQFEFGDYPVLDPVLKDLVEWKGNHTDFPHGPMFWVDRGDHVELNAVGSVDGKERHETICTLKKTLKPDEDTGDDLGVESREAMPDLLRIPTAADIIDDGTSDTEKYPQNGESNTPSETTSETPESKTVQEGNVESSTQPEAKSVVAASDGINDLSLNEKGKENIVPSTANVTTGAPVATAPSS